MTNETTPSAPRPGVFPALLILAGTFVFVAVFLGVYTLLGVGVPYIGLLFLLYWAAIRHQDFAEYLPSVAGGVIGIVVGWLLSTAPHAYGAAGSVVSYALLCGILFCFIRGQVKLVGNHCTLLFLLVSTIPELDVARNVVSMVESLLLAAAFMGLVAAALVAIKKRRRTAAD